MFKFRSVMFMLVVVLILAGLAVVGAVDKEVEQRDLDMYCMMVETGGWPDFKHIYKEECKPSTERTK